MADIKLFDINDKGTYYNIPENNVKLLDTPKKDYNAISEQAKEKLDNASTKESYFTEMRDMTTDVLTPMAVGAVIGGVKGHLEGIKNIQNLKNGGDTTLNHAKSIVANAESKEGQIKDLMKQNTQAAKEAFETGNIKKPLAVILSNSKKEAEIGPRFGEDVYKILEEDTNLSKKEINKIINKWYKNVSDSGDFLKLIEAKDPIVTYGHSIRVAEIAEQAARKAGVPEKQAKKIGDAALLHDIGKVQVPDNILNSRFNKDDYPELFTWLQNHDAVGGENIISITDPLASKFAKYHHKNTINDPEVSYVTISDIYDAITAPRSYKSGHSKDFALNNPDGLPRDIKPGKFSQNYLDLLKALDKDGLLNEYYEIDSDISDAYKSMKAHGIKDPIKSDYRRAGAKTGAIAGGEIGAITDIINKIESDSYIDSLPKKDKGGLEPTTLPSTSEVLSEVSPGYKSKADKISEMKKWYEKGQFNADIEMDIINTDFSNNTQVTELYKKWKKYFKD